MRKWFIAFDSWLTPNRAARIALWMAWSALGLQLVALAATIVRVEPHARDWFEANKPQWVSDLRLAIKQHQQIQARQQEQQRTQ